MAMIAILAAIAAPSFLEAQTRSEVARVQTDLRALRLAIESYTVDNKTLPFNINRIDGRFSADATSNSWWGSPYSVITTPIAYLPQGALPDPFAISGMADSYGFYGQRFYCYSGANQAGPDGTGNGIGQIAYQWQGYQFGLNRSWNSPVPSALNTTRAYVLWSIGPDLRNGYAGIDANVGVKYDPTNGTVSYGDIANFSVGSAIIDF